MTTCVANIKTFYQNKNNIILFFYYFLKDQGILWSSIIELGNDNVKLWPRTDSQLNSMYLIFYQLL